MKIRCPRLKGTPCTNNNGSFNFNKCDVCIDRVRPLFRPTLENRIYSGLEEFICKPNSRYVKRFPCVKKCLDVVAAWVDHMDVFCGQDTDVRETIIKYAIDNLVKDGLVTHFVDSVLLNNRVNRVSQRLDSLSMEQTILKNMNVWRFINEKDYWLCQNCGDSSGTSRKLSSDINSQGHKCIKRTKDNDVEVEIGSVAKEVQVGHCTCEKSFGCNSPCHRRISNAKSLELQACRKEPEVTSKPDQSTLRFAKINSDESKVIRATMTSDYNHLSTGQKNCKLKVVVHKTTTTNCSTLLNLAKVTSISVPCKPSHLIVRIFEADPSLSDTCLTFMRRKFENGIYNACSCLNNILKKLDYATIRDSCMSCEIRPGHIDLNLRHRRTFKVQLFVARVPTCHSVYKRDKCHRNTRSYENSTAEWGELRPPKDFDVPIDRCCKDMTKYNGQRKGQRVVFYSPCSNNSLVEEEKARANKAVEFEEKLEGKISKNELDFVWPRKVEKEVDFPLSPCFTRVQENENSAVRCVGIERDEKGIERSEEIDGNHVQSCLNEIKEEKEWRTMEDCCPAEQIVDANVKNEICENQSIAENSQDKIELCNSTCSSSFDRLKTDAQCECVSREGGSTTENCNSKECCHIFFRHDTVDTDEQTKNGVCANCPEPDNFKGSNRLEETDCFCYSGENTLKVQAISSQTKGNILKLEMSVQQMRDSVVQMKEVISEGKMHILQLKDSTLEAKAGISELARDAFEVKRGVYQAKRSISVEEEGTPRTKYTLETKKSISEMSKQYSVDSIYISNFTYAATDCDSKCSYGGIDLPNAAATNIEAESFSISSRPNKTYLDFEILKTSSSNLTKDTETKVNNGNVSISQPLKHTDFGRKYSENCEQILGNNNRYYGKVVPSATRANVRDLSRRSNVFTDRGSFSEKNLSLKSHETATKPVSCHRWSTLKPKPRMKTKHSMSFTIPAPSYSTKKLRGSESTTEMQNKTEEENYFPVFCRCRNRFWRSSIVPSKFCGSFQAVSVDRIKHLIRKKLRRMLLKQRDKGTSTSKTFLKNDRYLVSISSGKLTEKRITRKPCSITSSSNRCSFAAKNRNRVAEQGETFAERNFARRKKDTFEESVKRRCRKIIQDTEIFKKIKAVNISRILGQKRVVKSASRHKSTNEKQEGGMKGKLESRNKGRSSCNCGGNTNKHLSVASCGSARIPLAESDTCKKQMAEQCDYLDNVVYEGSRNLKEKKFVKKYHDVIDFSNSSSRRIYHRKKCPGYKPSQISFNGTGYENDVFCDMVSEDTEDGLRSDELRWLQKRLFNFEEDCDEDNDFARLFSNYERHISDLSADFRLKLLQYVALCRSVKDSLVTRLQSDDVYKVSLSSVNLGKGTCR